MKNRSIIMAKSVLGDISKPLLRGKRILRTLDTFLRIFCWTVSTGKLHGSLVRHGMVVHVFLH